MPAIFSNLERRLIDYFVDLVAVAAAIRRFDTNLVSGFSLLHRFVFNLDAVNNLF